MSIDGIKPTSSFYTANTRNTNLYKTDESASFNLDMSDAQETEISESDATSNACLSVSASSMYNPLAHHPNAEAIEKHALAQLTPMLEEKRMNQLKNTQYLCELVGKEPPETFEEMTETDWALFRANGRLAQNGGYMTLVGMRPNTVYESGPDNHDPIGFKHVYKNAFYMAEMQANFDYLYSNEGINDIISELNLSENVDKELLHKLLSTIGIEQTDLLNTNIAKTIDNMADIDAVIFLRYIRNDSAEGYADRMRADANYESVKNSMKQLYRDAVDSAIPTAFQQENPYEFMKQMEENSHKTSKVMFYLDGKEYTMQEFEKNFKALLLGIRNAF